MLLGVFVLLLVLIIGVVCTDDHSPYLLRHHSFIGDEGASWVMTLENKTEKFQHAMGVMYNQVYKGCDGEALDALEHYFWRYSFGTVMEIGAVDGKLLSQSLPFMEMLGWRRLLVEANPEMRGFLQDLPGRVWAVNAAICETKTHVHYIAPQSAQAKLSLTGGIVEFMSNRFAAKMHHLKLTSGTSSAKTNADGPPKPVQRHIDMEALKR